MADAKDGPAMEIGHPDKMQGRMKRFGGSQSDLWNQVIAAQSSMRGGCRRAAARKIATNSVRVLLPASSKDQSERRA